MKRDFDLIRKILLYVEENHKEGSLMINKLEDYDNQTLIFHGKLLKDQGLIEGRALEYLTPGNDDFQCFGLTSEGYEFLDKIRDNTKFKKAIKTIIDEGKDMTATVIAKVIEDQIGI